VHVAWLHSWQSIDLADADEPRKAPHPLEQNTLSPLATANRTAAVL
jgi:hypothetical protein